MGILHGTGEEDVIEPADGCLMEEDEAMIDRVVVAHDGDMIHWHCQVVVTEADLIMAKEEGPFQHEPANEIDENSPTDTKRTGSVINTGNSDLNADETNEATPSCERDDDEGHVDKPATRKGHDNPTS